MSSMNTFRASALSCCPTPPATAAPVATAPSDGSVSSTVREQYGQAVRVEQGEKPTLKGNRSHHLRPIRR